ncbi:hypothetical protein H6P81_019712 [Aristolochia fimbriata]|uniref:Patellin-4 n=1 Tax=Aristolochia fimbriata TaxID=158543 RepID=A0AAV7DVN2_ARIFI|nr:hypothetical protein H6P81_019712 [Aristolochia fimbriata]
MAVEVVAKSEAVQTGEVLALSQPEEPKAVAEEAVKVVDKEDAQKMDEERVMKNVDNGDASPPPAVSKNASFKEESNFLSDLKEFERKALIELRAKVEEAILANKLLEEEKEAEVQVGEKEVAPEKAESAENGEKKEEEENNVQVGEKKDEKSPEGVVEKKDQNPPEVEAHREEKPAEVTEEKDEKSDASADERAPSVEQEAKPDPVAEDNTEEKAEEAVEVDKDVSLWGVPLLPSKGDESTDVVLLKFLRAREFKVNEAFEMLRKTLLWRKAFNIDSILNEEFDGRLNSVAYMNGVDRDGHPVCYNVYGVFEDSDFYQKTFGTEEKREQFLRWRFQVMEKGIEKLNFKRGGVSSLLQITDLKSTPGPSKKELRLATKKAVSLLQDNYPEFVARNIFINVPFWYFAFTALISPFLTQRTKSKFVFARPSKVTETLLKYIPIDEISTQYGGLKRENDTEFSARNGEVVEVIVKGGSTETIEIPAPEVGSTIVWDLTVLGWEVNYKEEFVPTDEGSYTTIIQKGKKMGAQEEAVRNSFRNNEAGKVVLTVENTNAFRKKKLLYRYKV